MVRKVVNGHRKQQLSCTENQQNTVSFSNFIDARLTYNQPMHGYPHRCATYSERKYNRTIFQRFHKLPYELGGTPFGQWARSAPGPAINQGTPRAPSNSLHNKTTCNFTRGYTTFKHLSSGTPLPTIGAELRPARESSRAPRALPNNFHKTLRNRSGDTPSSLEQFTR